MSTEILRKSALLTLYFVLLHTKIILKNIEIYYILLYMSASQYLTRFIARTSTLDERITMQDLLGDKK